jgi:Fe-S cluster assembly protein SufD
VIEIAESQDAYLSAYEGIARARRDRTPSWLEGLRARGMARFSALGFPTTRHEEWRFTNVAPLAARRFVPPTDGVGRVGRDAVAAFTFPEAAWPQLVFVDGHYAAHLSREGRLPRGTIVASLASVFERDPSRVQAYLGRYAGIDDHAFRALNTALLDDGAFVEIPPGADVGDPIHLLFLSTGAEGPTMSHPRTVIVAGRGSRARLVESYAGSGDTEYFTNAVTEILVGANAQLEHCKLQRESRRAFHLASTGIRLERDARFTSQAVTLGGGLVRNEITAVLGAEGIDCTLNGVYLGDGDRLIDNHTAIDHASPNCTSHEVYKGILDGRARGVFNGKIFVRPDAQKTDAKQTNQVLLLSDEATIDTKPQLEIFADDVKCTHGATVGQLDEEALFYLRSRGIPREDARSLLIYAFASDIVSRIGLEPVRARIDAVLMAQLPASLAHEAAS